MQEIWLLNTVISIKIHSVLNVHPVPGTVLGLAMSKTDEAPRSRSWHASKHTNYYLIVIAVDTGKEKGANSHREGQEVLPWGKAMEAETWRSWRGNGVEERQHGKEPPGARRSPELLRTKGDQKRLWNLNEKMVLNEARKGSRTRWGLVGHDGLLGFFLRATGGY